MLQARPRPALLPISAWQQRMVATGTDAATSDAFLDRSFLRWAYRFRPRADERRIRRAFDKLVHRHDSLRLRFCQDATDVWAAEIQDRHTTGLVFEDLGDMDDDALMAEVNSRARAPMPVLSDALFQMHLLRFGRMGDVLLTRAHHAIVDAYGSGLIMEELFRLVMGLPTPFRPVSHGEATALRMRQLRKGAAASSDYWRNLLLPLPPEPVLGRHAKDLPQIQGPQIEATITATDVISQAECDALKKRAKASGGTLYAMLYTALAEVICAEAGCNRIVLGTVYSGRHVAALAGYVGPAMMLSLQPYAVDPARDLDDRVGDVTRQLAESADHLPTLAFSPEGEIGQAYAKEGRRMLQYFVHAPMVRATSATAGVLGRLIGTRNDRLSFGPVTISKLTLDPPASTDAELQLSVVERSDGTHVDLAADAAAFSPAELADIGKALRAKLAIPAS